MDRFSGLLIYNFQFMVLWLVLSQFKPLFLAKAVMMVLMLVLMLVTAVTVSDFEISLNTYSAEFSCNCSHLFVWLFVFKWNSAGLACVCYLSSGERMIGVMAHDFKSQAVYSLTAAVTLVQVSFLET